ncbi:DUF3881 family protein [bacterium C-53]|nr:DUF3881 family protein [Lachnospiraceae bacterium]NBI03098.1 DUF3881 family protein [Lachnospiraceae bacterium]RKJ10706.1 DUF3881 family protein [bacterium C-53]
MHRYLRAIGFSKILKRTQMQKIIKLVVHEASERKYVSRFDDSIAVEYKKEFAEGIGISVCGEYSDEDEFEFDYCYPYLIGTNISSNEDISVERHAEKESYAGICDDIKVGVSLIFYLQNYLDYMKEQVRGNIPAHNTSVNLSGLSVSGSIMIPLNKNEQQVQKVKKAEINRNQLIVAARRGDEDAIESLTLEDMDTYTTISRKILKEDIFSLVDTYFMPYGIECDQYSVLGEILDFKLISNTITKEEIYVMTINCNDLIFDVCINKNDLVGEPALKRRFKGVVWMQGHINFPD